LRPSILTGILCLALMLGLACVVSPDPSLWQLREAGPESSVGDAADSAPLDGPRPDRPADTTPPDTGPPPRLSCGAPELVGSNPPGDLSEIALRADGLELLARSGTTYSTTRSAPDQPFGDWTASSLAPWWQDTTFFTISGLELAIMARPPTSGAPRRLYLCTPPFTSTSSNCTPITVNDKTSGQEITDDMDGASVAVLPSGALLMAHNTDASGSGGADIHLAEPLDPSDLQQGWNSSPVSGLAQPGYKEDDPALSPDGLVLLFGGQTTAGDGDLWVSQRDSLSAAFPAPEPLANVNSASGEWGPYLAPLPAAGGKTRMELFFSSDRNGTDEVWRAECSR
jgi:hypothetical protein